jgi:S1-C subfamily serine protease
LDSVAWVDSSIAKIGDPIIAIGNSDYNNQSIMEGHITSILQSLSTSTNDFFELDLDLNKGDSGGPILDEKGRLLGMVMAKRESQQNSSIAIASNKIRQQYLQYKQNVP